MIGTHAHRLAIYLSLIAAAGKLLRGGARVDSIPLPVGGLPNNQTHDTKEETDDCPDDTVSEMNAYSDGIDTIAQLSSGDNTPTTDRITNLIAKVHL